MHYVHGIYIDADFKVRCVIPTALTVGCRSPVEKQIVNVHRETCFRMTVF